MKDSSNLESVIPVSRRNVMKAGAATAAGVGLFSGIASATNPRQINFCGCSQVCVDRAEGVGGTFYVVTAEETSSGWEFGEVGFGGPDDFCYEVEDDVKIIAVRPIGQGLAYCNPGQCAQKALEVAKEELDRTESEETGFECQNEEGGEPAFGTFPDIKDSESDVEIVHGQCGQAGRPPNPGGPNGPNGPNNGD